MLTHNSQRAVNKRNANLRIEEAKKRFEVGDRVKAYVMALQGMGVYTSGRPEVYYLDKCNYSGKVVGIYENFVTVMLDVGFRVSYVWHDVALGKVVVSG